MRRIASAIVNSSVSVALASLAFGMDSYCHDVDDRIPRLVGYGCVGSTGPLYANEEDHFPKCKAIEGNH